MRLSYLSLLFLTSVLVDARPDPQQSSRESRMFDYMETGEKLGRELRQSISHFLPRTFDFLQASKLTCGGVFTFYQYGNTETSVDVCLGLAFLVKALVLLFSLVTGLEVERMDSVFRMMDNLVNNIENFDFSGSGPEGEPFFQEKDVQEDENSQEPGIEINNLLNNVDAKWLRKRLRNRLAEMMGTMSGLNMPNLSKYLDNINMAEVMNTIPDIDMHDAMEYLQNVNMEDVVRSIRNSGVMKTLRQFNLVGQAGHGGGVKQTATVVKEPNGVLPPVLVNKPTDSKPQGEEATVEDSTSTTGLDDDNKNEDDIHSFEDTGYSTTYEGFGFEGWRSGLQKLLLKRLGSDGIQELFQTEGGMAELERMFAPVLATANERYSSLSSEDDTDVDLYDYLPRSFQSSSTKYDKYLTSLMHDFSNILRSE